MYITTLIRQDVYTETEHGRLQLNIKIALS